MELPNDLWKPFALLAVLAAGVVFAIGLAMGHYLL